MNKEYKHLRLRAQLAILKDVAKDYPAATIEHAIEQIGLQITQIEENDGKDY